MLEFISPIWQRSCQVGDQYKKEMNKTTAEIIKKG